MRKEFLEVLKKHQVEEWEAFEDQTSHTITFAFPRPVSNELREAISGLIDRSWAVQFVVRPKPPKDNEKWTWAGREPVEIVFDERARWESEGHPKKR